MVGFDSLCYCFHWAWEEQSCTVRWDFLLHYSCNGRSELISLGWYTAPYFHRAHQPGKYISNLCTSTTFKIVLIDINEPLARCFSFCVINLSLLLRNLWMGDVVSTQFSACLKFASIEVWLKDNHWYRAVKARIHSTKLCVGCCKYSEDYSFWKVVGGVW